MAKTEAAQKELDFDPEGLSDEEMAILNGETPTEGEEIHETPEAASEEVEAAEKAVAAASANKDNQNEEDEADSKEKSEKPPEGYVKHEAMYAERKRRQELERKMKERDEVLSRLAERLNGHGQPQQPAPRQEEQQQLEIDFLEDPEGAYKQALAKIQQLEQGFQGIQQKEQQAAQMTRQQQEQQQLEQSLINEYNETLQEDPALDDAVNYIVAGIEREYDTLGYSNSGISKQDYVKNTVFQHSVYARQTGTPVGQYLRNFASARGWSEANAPTEGGSQKAPSAAEKRVADLQQAQKRTRTLSRGASGDSGELTLETLDRMSPAELESFYAKHSDVVDKLLSEYEGSLG